MTTQSTLTGERDLTGARALEIIEAMSAFAWSADAAGRFTYVSPSALKFLGTPKADLDPVPDDDEFGWRRVVHPDDYDRVAARWRHCLKTGDHYDTEHRLRGTDGIYRWFRNSGRPTRDDQGRIVEWHGTTIDIEDLKQTETALRERESSLRELIETLPALVWCTDADGKPIYFSRQFRDFLGFDVADKDVRGVPRLTSVLTAHIHPEDLGEVISRFGRCRTTGAPYALKHRQRRFDGVYKWVETRANAIRNRDGRIVQWTGVCIDIDGEVQAQEELRLARDRLARASQAASLAELSASIAHEVNQPLAAIVANSHACQRWLTGELPNIERAQKTIANVIRDANATAEVVGHIRALFKHSAGPKRQTKLAGLAAEVRDLMADEAARRHIRVEVDVDPRLPPVALDRVQIQQVLVNLIRNGMEAMEHSRSDCVLALRVYHAGGFVRIEVSDHGRGIETPDRLFEPFFTTKEHGMGMGLAICRSIVQSHGGRLWAEQNEPHGAKLIFTLPLDEEAVPR